MGSWARFEIFAWGGDTPGVLVQEWTHEKMRKWTPYLGVGPRNHLPVMCQVLRWILFNQRLHTKVTLFTNLVWLFALVRENPVVFPEHRGGEQGNSTPTWEEACRLDEAVNEMHTLLTTCRLQKLAIHPMILEHHPYYDIRFSSSAIKEARIGVGYINPRIPFIDPTWDYPNNQNPVEGKYMRFRWYELGWITSATSSSMPPSRPGENTFTEIEPRSFVPVLAHVAHCPNGAGRTVDDVRAAVAAATRDPRRHPRFVESAQPPHGPEAVHVAHGVRGAAETLRRLADGAAAPRGVAHSLK